VAGEEDLVAFHVPYVDVGKGYVGFFQGGIRIYVGAVVLDARVDEEYIAFFDGIPFSVQHKVALPGEYQGDFYEVVAMGEFGFLSGQLAGEKERGVEVVVGDVVLYFAHDVGHLPGGGGLGWW